VKGHSDAGASLAYVIGVDGCAGGWITASRRAGRGEIVCRRIERLEALFTDAVTPGVVAVDVPIGLLARGARLCDVEARRLLGARRSSVFTPPLRSMLGATSQALASRVRRRLEGKGVSIQAWGIVPKIREVDRLLRADPGRCRIVREAHPELCFFVLNGGRPMREPKKTAAGRAERMALLGTWCGAAAARALGDRKALGCQADDIVDALVLLWTAERIQRGEAVTIPAQPPRDACGLRMEMVA
jgi:predicted RNase H-like nuclease